MTQTQIENVETSLLTTIDTDPTDFYDDLRSKGDIFWDEGVQAFLVTSPALIREISRMDDIQWFSPLVVRQGHVPYGLQLPQWYRYSGSRFRLTSTEGDIQRAIHRWWLQAFSSRENLEAWKETLAGPIANATIDRFVGAGEADLHEDYARVVGAQGILGVLGLPVGDHDWLEDLQKNISTVEGLLAHVGGTPDEETVEISTAATEAIHSMLMPFLEPGRSGTGGDFVSNVWKDADELWGAGEWDDDDVAAVIALAFMGGSETTVGVTANGIHLMMTQPEIQDQLREDPKAPATFAEEALRLHSNASFVRRVAGEDLELGGVPIKEGQAAIALTEALSKDPEVHPEPLKVRLDRDDPTDHYAFWRGPRQCPGRPLARMELETFFTVLVERLEDIQLDASKTPPVYEGFLLRKWNPLHATFKPRGG